MSTMTKLGRWTLVAALTLGLAGAAMADEVARLNTSARLLSRPGERAPSIVSLSAGQTVRVIGQEGRWLKVSARGRIGWITRTQVEVAEAPAAARTGTQAARPRAAEAPKARKGWNGKMDDEAVGADAAGDDEDQADDNETPDAIGPVARHAPATLKPAQAVKKVAKAEKKPWKPGEKVTLNGDASVRQRPSKKADELFTAEDGQEVKVVLVDDDGEWVRVQDADGTKGWVEASSIVVKGGDDDDVSAVKSDDGDDGDEDMPKAKKKHNKAAAADGEAKPMWYALDANIGVLSKSQDYTSAGTGIRSNYGLANTSPALIIGGIFWKRMSPVYSIGAEGSYMRTVGGSGIAVDSGMMMAGAASTTIPWAAQAIDVRGTVGYDVSNGQYQLKARVGYHDAATTIPQSMVNTSTAMLPSEKVSGITVGAGLDAPTLTPKVSLRVGVDMLVNAKLEQTAGMRDGTTSQTKAYYLNALAMYKWKPNMDLMATYTLSYEGFGFTGVNDREASATGAQRKDLQHLLGVGLIYKF